MNPVVYNSASLANSNLLDLGKDVEELYSAGVRFFHIDFMDGHYVPNLCFPIRILKDIRDRYEDAVLDVHMMVDDPIDYVDRIADVKPDYISFHADSTPFVIRTLDRIHSYGLKGGVVINPSQTVEVIKPYISKLDMVTLMAVEPGFAGQKFMNDTVGRVYEVSRMRKEEDLEFLINVDGAINYPNIIPSVRGGANVLVTGIYTVFQQPDGIISACNRLEAEIKKAFSQGFLDGVY